MKGNLGSCKRRERICFLATFSLRFFHKQGRDYGQPCCVYASMHIFILCVCLCSCMHVCVCV